MPRSARTRRSVTGAPSRSSPSTGRSTGFPFRTSTRPPCSGRSSMPARAVGSPSSRTSRRRSARRYLPDTNLLETTFTTDGGEVRVTDGLLFHGSGLAPLRELVRRVEGVAGTVPMRWVLEPRFGYGSARTAIVAEGSIAVATSRADAIALRSFDAGEPTIDGSTVTGRFDISAGSTSTLVMSVARGEPLVFPGRVETLTRLEETDAAWRSWVGALTYEGRSGTPSCGAGSPSSSWSSRRPPRSPEPRPPRSRRRSAASGTGTTGTRGSETPRSRSARSSRSAIRPRRRRTSGG